MVVSLNTNISALSTQRRLGETTAKLNKSFERLSSGLRINTAGDDAAGLAISESLKTDSRVYEQGIRNLNDGVSITNIAESTLNEMTNIVTRIQELAEQAANGTLSNTQRKSIDAEAQALSKEYFRVSRVAEFDGLRLFDGSTQGLRIQAGYGDNGGLSSSLGGALGSGSVSGSTTFTTTDDMQWSRAAEVVDINSDGLLDLVTVGRKRTAATGLVTVQLGLGGGSFGAALSYQTGNENEVALAIGDINGDGKLDITSAGYVTGVGGFATVRTGRGDGTFDQAISYQMASSTAGGIALADLNGDGILDLGVAGTSGADGYASIRLGGGNGTFGSMASYGSETAASADISFADLNGDSVVDLITAGQSDSSDGYATVRFGLGDGSFAGPLSYLSEANQSMSVLLTDLTNDGVIDMVTTGGNDTPDGYLSIRVGRGDGTFSQSTSYASDGRWTYAAAAADLNGDGVTDLVTAGVTDAPNDSYLSVWMGKGDGQFYAPTSQEIFNASTGNTWAYSLSVKDFNDDGVQDVLVAGTGQLGGSQHSMIQILNGDTREGVSPLLPFALKTKTDALQAIPMLKQTLQRVSSQRGTVGALQSRLSIAASNLQVARENYDSARSQITDVDVASESSQLLKTQITQQAASAVLGQANQAPALALQLLRG